MQDLSNDWPEVHGAGEPQRDTAHPSEPSGRDHVP